MRDASKREIIALNNNSLTSPWNFISTILTFKGYIRLLERLIVFFFFGVGSVTYFEAINLLIKVKLLGNCGVFIVRLLIEDRLLA